MHVIPLPRLSLLLRNATTHTQVSCMWPLWEPGTYSWCLFFSLAPHDVIVDFKGPAPESLCGDGDRSGGADVQLIGFSERILILYHGHRCLGYRGREESADMASEDRWCVRGAYPAGQRGLVRSDQPFCR